MPSRTPPRYNTIQALLSPMDDDDEAMNCSSCDEDDACTTSPESSSPLSSATSPDRSTRAILARLKTGQDVCVVVDHGHVNWVASYMQYGFDSNSIFRTIVPVRPTSTPWTQDELNYVQAIQRCIKDGHVRVPYGRCTATFIAERLHTTRERVHRYLKLVPSPSSVDGATASALAELKELRSYFLSTLERSVLSVMANVGLDQSWVVAIKY
ncbi:hypothetical protein SPRG_13028 [Saprolegnia parasitica CBS 223.65]|uniref:Uncharacterized protein n=1 Tax=Saprolegnia parasitica (strain CBS 223.65) TaxID=695850 RepID=A0A067BXZ6_SAPPC|nr:hypothetical protein SPRG_13028 [Saprolegnia parasitica CBS 223.65]KDO21690.1 hypothetical protein SPRG_13028 [Saprolegnia parasitica CBS 223.65]|eukprot:XP_012207612.1 hypothetical protein SPRG_13028 [Saprolegnia parasitica CBS 223.65]